MPRSPIHEEADKLLRDCIPPGVQASASRKAYALVNILVKHVDTLEARVRQLEVAVQDLNPGLNLEET